MVCVVPVLFCVDFPDELGGIVCTGADVVVAYITLDGLLVPAEFIADTL